MNLGWGQTGGVGDGGEDENYASAVLLCKILRKINEIIILLLPLEI